MVYNVVAMPTKVSKPKIMLVDGNALLHRGFHALPELSTKSGEMVNAVYGFTLILLKAIKDIKPTHIACAFDLAGPTFRHEQYREYKATRVKAPQELYDQIPRVKEVVRVLNIPIFEKQGFEADDVLGTLAANLYKKYQGECEIIIATGDLDTLQLVNHGIKVYTLRKGITDVVIYDAKAVRERYGLNPEQMIDFKALKGDPSDNIPGVEGIGEKSATELIKEFKNLDNLYRAIKQGKTGNKIKPRILKLLVEQEEQARLSYELSKIVCNVPIKIEVPPYEFGQPHLKQTYKLFQELQFKSLLRKLPTKLQETKVKVQKEKTEAVPAASQIQHFKQRYQLIDSRQKLDWFLDHISHAKEVAVDTETTNLKPLESELVGVGLSWGEGEAYYIPARLVRDCVELRRIFEKGEPKIGHNLKYDLLALRNSGINLSPLGFDTMIASYLLDPGTRQHNLDTLAFNELGYQMQPIEELIGKGKKQISMAQVPEEQVSWYCCEDVDMTLRLKKIFEPQLEQAGLKTIFRQVEMPLIEVLADMEAAGIRLDNKFLNQLAGEAEVEIKKLEQEIYRLTGTEFNINSPLQLKEVLFKKLGLQPIENRRTKTGLSTAAGELEKMIGQHPVIPKLLEYRELTKLQSTYLLALPELVSKKTGRLHTSFNQTVTATGRLSSTDPNLQNIPVRGEGLGSQIRRAFVAEKGYKLLSLDYSQIELRIVAHLSQDKKMMEIFKKGEDIHEKTAMEIFGVSPEQVTKDMRRDAKTINFGILYGLSSFGLSYRIGQLSRAEAKEFIQKYFRAYPGVERYIEQIKLQVNEEGFVRNELGRIRRFPEIKSSQYQVRAAAERAAVNFPIQSLAADVIKVAMINIYREIRNAKSEIRMLLQVHDELVFEVSEDQVNHYARLIRPFMEDAIKLSVPVSVEAKAGDNWGEMEEIKF